MNILVCGAGSLPPGEHGTPPIMVEKNADCKDCGRKHDLEKCPKCGSWIEVGWGLMFGGFGEYKFCQNDKCDWFWKRILPPEED